MTGPLRFDHESASLSLIFWTKDKATVDQVFAIDRGKGHATGLLKKVTSYADSKKIILLLEVGAYGEEPRLNDAQLISFYEKFGFEVVSDRSAFTFMTRIPK